VTLGTRSSSHRSLKILDMVLEDEARVGVRGWRLELDLLPLALWKLSNWLLENCGSVKLLERVEEMNSYS